MKETIYTIPITDALKEANYCPFCFIKEKLEKETLEYTIGPSYMEGDIREKSDKEGFCNRHYEIILKEQNKLGVALMAHTHIQKLIKDIEALKDKDPVTKKSVFKKNNDTSSNPLNEYIADTSSSCIMCTRVSDNFNRYLDSFIYLFNHDEAIKSLFLNSKGVCYTHLSEVLDQSKLKMKEQNYIEFKNLIIKKELENLKMLEEDLDFFIKKFDYKNNHLPWGDKKDVLERVSKILK